jgi:hypothetical protein
LRITDQSAALTFAREAASGLLRIRTQENIDALSYTQLAEKHLRRLANPCLVQITFGK